MEDIIDTVHGVLYGCEVSHIADIEADLIGDLGHFGLKFVAHIVLLFFIA